MHQYLTEQVISTSTVLVSAPHIDNFQFSSTISPPHIDGNLASQASERRTVLFRQLQFGLPFGGSKSRSSIFRPKAGLYKFAVLPLQIRFNL